MSFTLRKATEAIRLCLTWFYQVQKSSNYFLSDHGEIRNVGFCNPCYCVVKVASLLIHTSLHENSVLLENLNCCTGVIYPSVAAFN